MHISHLYPRASDPNVYQIAIQKSTFNGEWSRNSVIVTLSIALGLYNSLEMILLIISTFKRRRGLYFWSLSLCDLGVILYSLGITLTYFQEGPLLFSKIILDVGWLLMVICQSLILFSRLNLILENQTILNAIKWYVIVDSFALGSTTVILDFGVTYTGKESFARAYFYMEHVQMTGFTLQEVIISGVYIWKTLGMLRIIQKKHTRSMIWQLLVINIIIIVMDILLIFLQFKHYQLYQESIKGFVYSVKLKLELNILSKLVDLVQRPKDDERSMTIATVDSNTFIGQERIDIQRELRQHDTVTNWMHNDHKNQTTIRDFEGSQSSQSSEAGPFPELVANPLTSHPVPNPTNDLEVARMRSQTSSRTVRTSGRESDMLYAEMLRSMTKD